MVIKDRIKGKNKDSLNFNIVKAVYPVFHKLNFGVNKKW